MLFLLPPTKFIYLENMDFDMIMPKQPFYRKRRRIPRSTHVFDKLAGIVNDALIEKFSTAYSGYPFEKKADNKYYLHIGSLEVIVYTKGRRIVTELKNVPDAELETTLMNLMASEELFSNEESPLRKQQQTINMYRRLFKREDFKGNGFVYVLQESAEKTLTKKRKQVVDTIINYMIKPLLFLLPGPSKKISRL